MKQAVGIFFIVNGNVIFDNVSLEQGEHYGETIGFSGHYDYWQTLIPKNSDEKLFKSHEYDYFPRGRVVYFMKSNSFRLYADHCLKKADIEKVASLFHLPIYELARDQHYQCAVCNSEYIDI